jgi:hypothetical protein
MFNPDFLASPGWGIEEGLIWRANFLQRDPRALTRTNLSTFLFYKAAYVITVTNFIMVKKKERKRTIIIFILTALTSISRLISLVYF